MTQPFLELNADVTEAALRRYGEQLVGGRISLSQFNQLMEREITSGMVAAFRFANRGPLTADQVTLLNNLLAEQRAYFARFVAGLRDGTVPLAGVANRSAMYGGSVVAAGAYGAVTRDSNAGATFTWSGPDGDRACVDCGSRIGRTFTRDELLAAGVPGRLTCMGNCRCTVSVIEAPVAA